MLGIPTILYSYSNTCTSTYYIVLGGTKGTKGAKEFAKACASMPRSAAMWLQPMGLRTLAREREGMSELLSICQRILNGEVPGRARGWLYNHRIVALSKLSRHQADQEVRARAPS